MTHFRLLGKENVVILDAGNYIKGKSSNISLLFIIVDTLCYSLCFLCFIIILSCHYVTTMYLALLFHIVIRYRRMLLNNNMFSYFSDGALSLFIVVLYQKLLHIYFLKLLCFLCIQMVILLLLLLIFIFLLPWVFMAKMVFTMDYYYHHM